MTDNAFDGIDACLGEARGSDGIPSSADFLALEMPGIIERFAMGFDSLVPAISELPGVRVLIDSGTLVRTYAVAGMLLTDDSIELIGIEIEL